MTTLQYVQIDIDQVLIDSRVYCCDIIQVDHGDWISNVLYKHENLIEKHFGAIRFQNGSKKYESGRYNPKPEKYALLTEAQCNFALTLSRNSAEVVIKKAELVADFEKAKQLYVEFAQNTEKREVLPITIDNACKLTYLIQPESR